MSKNKTFSLDVVQEIMKGSCVCHMHKTWAMMNKEYDALQYLAGALPHVLHVCISHLGMNCWQWVIQLSRWIYPQEQDKCLMGQSLEKVAKRKSRLKQAHLYLHFILITDLPATKNIPPTLQIKQTAALLPLPRLIRISHNKPHVFTGIRALDSHFRSQ